MQVSFLKNNPYIQSLSNRNVGFKGVYSSFNPLYEDVFQFQSRILPVSLTNNTKEDEVYVERVIAPNNKTYEIVCDKDKNEDDFFNCADADFLGIENDFFVEILRDMQWNNGNVDPPQKWWENNHKQNPDKFPTKEVYAEFLKKQAFSLIESQYELLDGISPLEYSHTLYRAVKLNTKELEGSAKAYADYINNAQVGDVITPDWTPTYAARDVRLAFDYDNENLLVIKTNPGAKLFVPKDKKHTHREVLFPAMSQFKVLSKKNIHGLNVIELEYLHENKPHIDDK